MDGARLELRSKYLFLGGIRLGQNSEIGKIDLGMDNASKTVWLWTARLGVRVATTKKKELLINGN